MVGYVISQNPVDNCQKRGIIWPQSSSADYAKVGGTVQLPDFTESHPSTTVDNVYNAGAYVA